MEHILLNQTADHYCERLLERQPELAEQLTESQWQQTRQAFAFSDFIAESCIRQPERLVQLLESGELEQAERQQAMEQQLNESLAKVTSEDQLKRALRQFRRWQMVVIAWRELLGEASLDESLSHVSWLADLCIAGARDWLYDHLCKSVGTPCDPDGNPQSMLVLGMGKLGGRELNFSSDIDLIFTFPEKGVTRGGRRELDNQQFFIRLGQRLVQTLNETTVDGFVFRVDMRLRPFGDAGPLVISFAALEEYYQNQGRDWERYAMVKARVIGSPRELALELRDMLRPFVFRRYIDFSALQSLRQMKALISAEVRRKGLVDNIKLGAGGIREVEFVAQALQLIRGGREPSLRCRSLRGALQALAKLEELPAERIGLLLDGYNFLREVENRLQQFNDQQTQTLPDNELDQTRLYLSMGFESWDSFYQHLNRVMESIHHEFQAIIGEDEESQHEDDSTCQDLWLLELTPEETLGMLEPLISDTGQALALAGLLNDFKEDCHRRHIGPRGRQVLKKLMPELLEEILAVEQAPQVFERICQLLRRIISRTAYLELLQENSGARTQLIRLCGASGLVANKLATYPILLDELLDPQHLYNPTALDQYGNELRQFMLRVPPEDLEQQMEALRQYKQIQLLRIAAADIAGALPLMKVSDHLTFLAEAIVGYVVNLVWQQMLEKFGEPGEDGALASEHFAVLAYGKMGGLELGYSSDLDLVFIHNAETKGYTKGPKQIDIGQFYIRFAQRILHLFSTRTASGILYEVDMRLRPAGESGMLVSPIKAYEKYLQEEAWTWEHQALVRARPVFGGDEISAQFAEVRHQILCQQRADSLVDEVRNMRLKMRKHLQKGGEEQFDLKQAPGGITDIEFITQYLVLAQSNQYPKLTQWSDNVRILNSCMAAGLLEEEEGVALSRCYCTLRDETHRLSLQDLPNLVDASRFQGERQLVTSVWQKLLGE